MWRAAGIVLLTAYLPGALAFRLPFARRARRAALPAEERFFWAVVVSVAVSSVAALALAAAGAYRIENLLLTNGLLCLAAAAVSRLDLRLGPPAPGPTRTAVPPCLLAGLAACTFFFAPPAEYVMGGRDPGVYVNEGIRIAQTGSLTSPDPLVRTVPREHRRLFFPPDEDSDHEGLRFMGFFVVDPDAGSVVGQFSHLYPAWTAIAYDVHGLTGARHAPGLLAVLGVLAVYFAGAALLGRAAAFAGAALLALHVAQVWYARYPNGEVAMQALVFAGLLAYARAHADGDRFFAPVAAVLIGLSVFAHVTGVLVIGGAAMAALFGLCAGQRLLASFVVPLAAASGVAAIYYLSVLAPYSARIVEYPGTLSMPQLALAAAGAALVAAFGFAAARPRFGARARVWFPRLLLAAVWGLAAYALFFRTEGPWLAPHDAAGLRTYTDYYLGPLGLAAALTGWAVVSGRRFWRSSAFLIVSATCAVFIFYKARIWPEHFWAARRFIPVILPASLLLAGAAAFSSVAPPARKWLSWARTPAAARARLIAGVALAACLGWQFLERTRPILRHVELAGLIPEVEAIAGRLTPADLLLVESRAASDLHVLALPLAYVYARNVLLLHDTAPDKTEFRRFLGWARSRYARVLFMGGGGTHLLSRDVTPRSVWGDRFQIPQYEQALNAYPTGVRRKEFGYTVYDLVPGRVQPGVFHLDVGAEDDLHVRRVHAKQRDHQGVTYRWTRDRSFVAVTGTLPEARELTLRLGDGGRPERAAPARVRLTLGGRRLGSVDVAGGFRPYAVPIPSELAREVAADEEPAELLIETQTWNPRVQLGTPDDRDLGVMVDRIEIR